MVSITKLFGKDATIVYDSSFQFLLAANVIAVLGTALLSPILDSLTGPFGVSAARIGLMITAFTAPAAVLIPVTGVLTDRFGRKPVLVAGLLLFGSAGVAIAFTTDFRLVLGLRLLQGVGFAGTIPVIITAIGDLYTGDAEATGQGLRFGVSGLSQAIFPALAGLLVVTAWQYPFLLYGLAIPVAAAVHLRLEEPAGHRGTIALTPDGGKDDAGRSSDETGSDAAYARRLFALTTQPRVAAILLARGLIVVPFIGFLTYNSLIVVRLLDGTPRLAGVLVAVFSVVYAVTATQAGRITAIFDSRLFPLVTANACLAIGLPVFTVAPRTGIATVGVVVLGVGVGLTFSLYRSIITGLASESLRGGLVSLGESLGRLAGALTPLGMGLAIALLEPELGTGVALQWAAVGAGLFGGLLGAACVLVAWRAPSVQHS